MKKHKKGTRAKYSTLVSAVLIGLMSITPYASADESEYLATEYIDYNGRNIAELIFLKEGQGIGNNGQWMVPKAVYDLPDALITGAATSATYWTDMLGPTAKNKEPWQIFVTTYWQRNASSSSLSVKSDGVQPIRKSYKNAEHYVSQQLQNGTDYDELTYDKAKTGVLPEGSYAYSRLRIGYYSGAKRTGAEYGWWVDTDTVLPTNEQAVNFAGTVRHELGHALGIVAKRRIRGDNTYFTPGVTDEKSWNLQLYDQNGNKAQSGMQIITSYEFEELKKDKPSISPKDYFIVDKKITDEGEGFAYFSGKNVVDALDGATFFGRSALPVNGWEGDRFEGSHIQTSGMMSHRTYSNYSAFLEVELAALQDLGYDIDRKAYFGRSIYGNKGTIVNNQGFFARNQTGTAYLNNAYSDVNLGIGLHVYGYGNTVTQAADIMTKGNGGTGIRVDGMENTLIIPKDTEIHADGYRGNGVMISYGRNQTVEQAGTVTANGDGGVGMRFDFGSARGGAGSEYRGSYIRYKRWVNSRASGREPGAINSAQNYALTYNMNANTRNVAEDELVGPLVDNYNLSGKLAGSDAAIYISKNALVKNINVNDGASIQGDIVSEWKRFDRESCEEAYNSDGKSRDVLRIQYNNNIGKDGYEYYLYIPDLVTNLNFNNEEMKYTGNISGEENIKMNVNEGTLTYTGEANVINVQVAKDATLLGGSYQVNDLSQKLDKDFTDDTTGKFYNHGTIGAESQNSDMLIKGKLISDGVLAGYAGGDKGQIVVSGTADVEGSMISIDNALPGDEMTVLKADSITGTIGNGDESYAASGMLSTTGTVSGNEIKVQTVTSNNLGDIDSTQQAAYNAMTDMYKQLDDTGDDRIDEMRKLYSLDTDNAKEALSSLSANAAAKTMALAQTNTVTSRIISSRLTEAFAKKDVNVAVPGAGLDNGASKDTSVKMKVDQPVDNDFWFKTMRNWGDSKNSSYYQGTTLAGGWDRAYGKHWRAGAFISHGMFSFTDNTARDGIKDTRLGLYGGYSKGAHSGFVYLDYGWINNDLSRKLGGLDMQATAKYDSRIIELGGEYKYDMNAHQMTDWHMSPYATVQLSRLTQDGYTEQGAGIFGQQVNRKGNTYFAGGVGMEFKRYLTDGSYALRLGVKHAFSGADPRLTYSYAGNEADTYELRGQQDRTHFVMSIGGEAEFEPGWTLAGDLSLQKGAHDKDIMAAVTLRRMW